MSEYKGIKGFQVQTRTEDPTPYAQALADNPYAGSWAAGGTRNEARGALGGSIMGTQTANVAAGGTLSGSVSANAETYNGSSWTEGNNLNQARRSLMAAGLEPAGRVFGGDTSVNSTGFVATNESYNGTSFTEETDLNTGAGAGTGIGLTTAALAVGGSTGPGAPNYSNKVENWDGSSWTEVSEINTTRIRGGGAGITTAALFSGGQAAPGASANVETWNGSSWTETTDINTARGYIGSAGASYTAALIYGGSPSRAITESWDGTSWTEVADLATGQSDNFGIVNGTNLLALSSGGETSPNALTEEWAFSGLDPSSTPAASYADAITGDFYYNSTTGQFKTVNTGGAPLGAWASGNAMPTAVAHTGSAGTPSSAFAAGGYNPPSNKNTNYLWNGTSWSDGNNINSARQVMGASGTATSGLIFGGSEPPNTGKTEEFDGTNWTESGDLNSARGELGGTGTQTAALAFAGTPLPTVKQKTESYNGSTWTALNDMNRGGGAVTGWGTTGGAICAIGTGVDPSVGSESWDGTSWTNGPNTNHANFYRDSAGAVQTDGLIWGGYEPPGNTGTANTESWNGTAFTEVADLATKRYEGTDIGTGSLAAVAAGGVNATTYITNTEEWTAADFQIKSVTTS